MQLSQLALLTHALLLQMLVAASACCRRRRRCCCSRPGGSHLCRRLPVDLDGRPLPLPPLQRAPLCCCCCCCRIHLMLNMPLPSGSTCRSAFHCQLSAQARTWFLAVGEQACQLTGLHAGVSCCCSCCVSRQYRQRQAIRIRREGGCLLDALVPLSLNSVRAKVHVLPLL